MGDSYFALSERDRREALAAAAADSGRPDYLLEKDIHVVLVLAALFEHEIGSHLCFKGGTSLSKGFGLIRRFSEDIDITYDIRALLSDRLEGMPPDPIPGSRSEADNWSRMIRKRLPTWVEEAAVPALEQGLTPEADVRIEPSGEDLRLIYPSVLGNLPSYVAPSVRVEFGARSTGEPMSVEDITCDAAAALPGVDLPTARPRTMAAERTFWEKATAVHVFCRQNSVVGDRLARHWYDLSRLYEEGVAHRAVSDTSLARRVAAFKRHLFRAKDAAGRLIDYEQAVGGDLQLVPGGDLRAELERDYREMTDAGLIEEPPSLERVLDACAQVERMVSGSRAR